MEYGQRRWSSFSGRRPLVCGTAFLSGHTSARPKAAVLTLQSDATLVLAFLDGPLQESLTRTRRLPGRERHAAVIPKPEKEPQQFKTGRTDAIYKLSVK